MKKLLIIFTFLFLPLNVFAYSEYIIPGGATLGINVDTKGIMVIGFYKIDGKYNKGSNELQAGDYITKVNNEKVTTTQSMADIIEKYAQNGKVTLTFTRDDKEYETIFDIIYEDNKYKTGLYVKDSIKGIGTLSYIDPSTNIYGALGHEIIDSNSNKTVEIKSGAIFYNEITGIEKSSAGSAGSKLASFDYDNVFGNISKNSKYGIYGNFTKEYDTSQTLKVGSPKIGKAYIRTVIDGTKAEDFEIEITKINETSAIKNITLKIISSDLTAKTGGIVQGMSGSPIIQDNEIVGVLTHVIVDNPITGYGVFITTMLEEGEKN